MIETETVHSANGARAKTKRKVEPINTLRMSDVEAEKFVLGSVIEYQQMFTLGSGLLSPDYFSTAQTSLIFQAVAGVAARRDPVNVLTVTRELLDAGVLDEVGGAAVVGSFRSINSQVVLEHEIGRLRDLAMTREVVQVTKRMAEIGDLSDPMKGFGEVLAAMERLNDKAKGIKPGTLPPIAWASGFLSRAEPEPPELVVGLLHESCKLVVGGSSKSFKTWTLLDLGLSVAGGVPWLGFETVEAPVLYLNFEIPAPFFHSRLKRIMEAKGLENVGRLALWNLRGFCADLARVGGLIVEQAKREGFRLIIIDPLYKLLGGRNENASNEMGELMNQIERIAVDTGAAVAFGAHFSKGNQSQKESIDRISGSGVFARDPDSILTMTAHDEPNAFAVEPILRNHPPVEPFVIRWEFPLMKRDGALDPTKLKKPKTGREAVYDDNQMLKPLKASEDGLAASEWQVAVEKDCGMSKRTFYDRKKVLERDRKVREDMIAGKWVVA